ncbi:MAG: PEGA domain-containing protein [Planctomycetota bacterium]
MMKKTTLLTLLVLVGIAPMSAMAAPGDLLQTFPNPRPSTRQADRNFWVTCRVAGVGKNLLVGFARDDTFGMDAGAVYLFDTSTGKVVRTFKSPEPGVGHNFGCSVAAVGSRIVIGEYRATSKPNLRRAGAAYIFDASTGELLHTLAKPSTAAEDYFGHPVAVLGENFLATCERDDTGAKDAGTVFLYDGTTGELLQVFRKPKPAPHDGFGRALAVVGDNLLVGDDLDDTKGPGAGAAHLLDGSTGELLRTFYNPLPGRGHGFAKAVAALGSNILVAEKSFKPSRAEGGSVYLFDGVTGELLRTFQNPNPVVDDGFGLSVAAVGDNVLIGANHAHANGLNVGAAYLFDGSNGKLLHTFLNPTPGWNDQFGVTVAALGENIVISAPLDDTAGIDAGAIYLFEGGASADFQALELPPVSESKTTTTRLYVRTTPPGARVLLDGQPIGKSPGLFFAPSGDHKITFELPGYAPQSQPVTVLDGQITRLDAQLKRSP